MENNRVCPIRTQFAPKLWEVTEVAHKHHDRENYADPVFLLGKGVTRLEQGSTRQGINHAGGRYVVYCLARAHGMTIGSVLGSVVFQTFVNISNYFQARKG